MKSKLISFVAIAGLLLAIFFGSNSALADTVEPSQIDSVRQAAQETVKPTGVKEQFGKTSSGDRLLDDAKQEANQKLNNLADEASSDKDLPDSKKLFLKNLNNE